jgi:hypothetical protein
MAGGAKVEPTEDWGQLELLLKFPEQVKSHHNVCDP